MKKLPLILLFIILNKTCFSQEILVPFRVGDKMSLSNKMGEIVIDSLHDKIEIINTHLFKYANIKENKTDYGVYFNQQLIIKNQNYPAFFTYKNQFIVGSMNEIRPEHCAIFNMKGQRLIKEQLKNVSVNDYNDIKNFKRHLEKEFTFISFFEEKKKNNFNLVVFDKEKQKISQWLLKQVSDFKVDEKLTDIDNLYCSYQDGNEFKKIHFYYDENLKIFKEEPYTNKSQKTTSLFNSNYDEMEIEEMVEEEMVPERANSKKTISYKFVMKNGDSLLYFNEQLLNTKKIHLISKYKNPHRQTLYQKNPFIYKKKGKFGVITHLKKHKAKYDSILYIDYPTYNDKPYHFLVGKKSKNSWKFGIINEFGDKIIPVIYEDIAFSLEKISFDYQNNARKIVLKKDKIESYHASLTYNTKHIIFVKKDGKQGIINLKNEILLPIEYNFIAKNNIKMIGAFAFNANYIIIKKGEHYGIIKGFIFNSLKISKPNLKYPALPVRIILNYFEKDLDLIQLESETHFYSYANSNGIIYYKK